MLRADLVRLTQFFKVSADEELALAPHILVDLVIHEAEGAGHRFRPWLDAAGIRGYRPSIMMRLYSELS